MASSSTHKPINILHRWRKLFAVSVLSAYFYASMEWLFFVTKPSSLSNLSALESLKVLLVTGGTVALILLAFLVVLSLPAFSTRKANLLALGYIVPAFILSLTTLILLDNFTYTLFKFGIISTEGIERVLYALGFLFIFWRMLHFVQQNVRTQPRFAAFLAPGLLTVSIAGILSITSSTLYSSHSNLSSADSTGRLPNIIVLGSDGLSAQYLSAYGYPLKTTPFLNELAETSLVAENAFPNATSTTASTTAALTGKEAIKVRVYRYPDILTGKNSFEHLPGILKQHGYQTMEVGTPYYVDARRLNLLDGFDIINNQTVNQPAFDAIRGVLGNSPSTYFLQTITDRASERLLHIFYLQRMQNAMSEVNNPNTRFTDEQRVDQILDLLDHADQPVFVFAHLMDTHGPIFAHPKQVFSQGPEDQEWDTHHYLDAILSYDSHVKKIYDHLAQTGQLDNTILVIYTDHGLQYTIKERIPLILHFPKNQYAGKLKNNVQVIDIPATLLDYIGIPAPKWMDGISLLKGEPPAEREIFSTAASSPPRLGAPFYQLRLVQVIACQKWYTLSVKANVFASGIINRHSPACDPELLPSESEVHRTILEYLEENGYDISLLQ